METKVHKPKAAIRQKRIRILSKSHIFQLETTGLNIAATPSKVTLILAMEQLRVLPVPQTLADPSQGELTSRPGGPSTSFHGTLFFPLTQLKAVPASAQSSWPVIRTASEKVNMTSGKTKNTTQMSKKTMSYIQHRFFKRTRIFMAQRSNLFDRLFPRNTSKSDKLHLFQWAAYASTVNGVCYKREWMFSSILESCPFSRQRTWR